MVSVKRNVLTAEQTLLTGRRPVDGSWSVYTLAIVSLIVRPEPSTHSEHNEHSESLKYCNRFNT